MKGYDNPIMERSKKNRWVHYIGSFHNRTIRSLRCYANASSIRHCNNPYYAYCIRQWGRQYCQCSGRAGFWTSRHPLHNPETLREVTSQAVSQAPPRNRAVAIVSSHMISPFHEIKVVPDVIQHIGNFFSCTFMDIVYISISIVPDWKRTIPTRYWVGIFIFVSRICSR